MDCKAGCNKVLSFVVMWNVVLPLLLFGVNFITGETWTIHVNVGGQTNAQSGGNFYLDVNGTNQDETDIELGSDFQKNERRQIQVHGDFGKINSIRIYQYGTDGLRVQNITISTGSRHLDFTCNCWVDGDQHGPDSRNSWTLYPEGLLWTIQILTGGEVNGQSQNNFFLDVVGTNQDKYGIELGKFPTKNVQRQVLVNVDFGEINRIRIYSSGGDGLSLKNITMSNGFHIIIFVCNCWVDGDSISSVSNPSWTLNASSVGRNSLWKQCKDGRDIVYKDVKFQISVYQNWECAKACMDYGESCSAYSIVSSNMTCYGYGEMDVFSGVPGAQLWKRICNLQGYAYVQNWRKCVKIYTDHLTWDEASSACQANGAVLLRFDNNEFLYSIVPGDTYWIGARIINVGASLEYQWENEVAVDQAYWAPNQPSNNGSTCITGTDLDQGLHDDDCNASHGYICQEPTC